MSEIGHNTAAVLVGLDSYIISVRAVGRGKDGTALLHQAIAAPDMLAALKDAENWLSGWASAEPYLATIRAAIAKAEGRQP